MNDPTNVDGGLSATDTPERSRHGGGQGGADAVRAEPVVVVAIFGAITGYLAVWVPWYLAGAPKNMIDGMQLVSFLWLALVGFVGGVIAPRRFWVAGLFAASLLPVRAIVQAIGDPTSHSLLGIEFIVYGFFAATAIVGGALGRGARTLIAG